MSRISMNAIFKALIDFFTPSQETVEGMIAQSMWTDGYTDLEIELEIRQYRNKLAKYNDETNEEYL